MRVVEGDEVFIIFVVIFEWKKVINVLNFCIFIDMCFLFEFVKFIEEYCVKLCNVFKFVEFLENRGGVFCWGYCFDMVFIFMF